AYTHVFLQGGVGGFPAGIIADLWERTGVDRPHFIIVEPAEANCLLQSALHGGPVRANGSVDSLMAGLACGDSSQLASRILDARVNQVMTVDDGLVTAAM